MLEVEGEGEWHRRKHGRSKRRIWRKLHIGIDEGSLGIRSVEMTGNEIGDAPVLPAILEQIPEDEEIASVTADGAYDTRQCHETVANRGTQAVIFPRKNAKPWDPTSAGAITRNEALRACGHLGRAIWKRWSGYLRRSRVETKMHCIKLLGQRLTARDFDRQITEVQSSRPCRHPQSLHSARYPPYSRRRLAKNHRRVHDVQLPNCTIKPIEALKFLPSFQIDCLCRPKDSGGGKPASQGDERDERHIAPRNPPFYIP